jgi:hypothetical protein
MMKRYGYSKKLLNFGESKGFWPFKGKSKSYYGV